MKKNLNPFLLLEISTRTLIKKRRLYSPEEWARIQQKLLEIGKGTETVTNPILRRAGIRTLPSGGLLPPEEYARRMEMGQLHRARKLSREHGRELKVTRDPRKGAQHEATLFTSTLNLPQDSFEASIYSDYHSPNPFKKIRGYFRKRMHDSRYVSGINPNKGKNQAINDALTTNHEVEELSKGLKYSKRNDLNIIDSGGLKKSEEKKINKKIGNHNPGVLRAERRASDRIETLYGPEYGSSIIRGKDELAHDSFRPKFSDQQKFDYAKSELERIKKEHPENLIAQTPMIKDLQDAYDKGIILRAQQEIPKQQIIRKLIAKKRSILDNVYDKNFKILRDAFGVDASTNIPSWVGSEKNITPEFISRVQKTNNLTLIRALERLQDAKRIYCSLGIK